MPASQLPPALLARATRYGLDGLVHFPKDCIGDVISYDMEPGTALLFIKFNGNDVK